jgi:hypothetical protein
MGLTTHELVAYVFHDLNIFAKPNCKTQDVLLWKLQAGPKLQAFFWFLQVSIPTHAFVDKWSFWDGFEYL